MPVSIIVFSSTYMTLDEAQERLLPSINDDRGSERRAQRYCNSNLITTTKEARCSTLSQAAGIANALAMSFYLPVLGADIIF